MSALTVSSSDELGRRGRRPRAPGVAMLSLTLSVLLIVVIMGITSRSAPPPTVAQFAPQAVQQIKKAPPNQDSRFGTGAGGTGNDGRGVGRGGNGGTSSPTPRASGPALPVGPAPVTRRCVGNPPRQIEDSQSPPCVSFWQGDNGGATSKGVTADTIRVAVPFTPKADPGGTVAALENFFNSRFEFYGRKLRLEQPFGPREGNSDDPQTQRNDAALVDSRNFFASTGYSYNYYYTRELARRGVISVTSEPYYAETDLTRLAPYVWAYEMGLDNQFDSMGAWVCNRLAGRNATRSSQYGSDKRKFGVVHFTVYPELPVSITPLVQRMEGCGAKPAIVLNQGTQANAADPQQAQSTAQKLKDAGVTSVICTCNFAQTSLLMRGSTAQLYFPEWLLSTYVFNDTDYALHRYNADQQQLAAVIGTTFQPRELLPQNTPAIWAVKEGSGRPTTAAQEGTQGMYELKQLYHDLLVVASGIQMAGPRLTPETFQAGLQRAVFPNPQDGYNQGKASFLGDHSMTEDGAEFYWHNQAVSPYADVAGQGAFCYVERGTRRRPESWPKGNAPYGQLPCDSRDR